MKSNQYVTLLALCTTSLLTACTTLPTARPLHPGEHQAGVSLGGPMVNYGGTHIPLPNAVVEGRSGIRYIRLKPLDINYGLNVTAAAFGIAQLHLGTSYLLLDENGFIPALSMTNRLFVATNALTPQDKAPGTKQAWGAHQLAFTASYMIKNQLIYLGLDQYTDFGLPQLLLTPSLGVEFDPGHAKDLKFHLEARYYAINKTKSLDTVEWTTHPRGAFGFGLGLSYTFGQRGCSCSVK